MNGSENPLAGQKESGTCCCSGLVSELISSNRELVMAIKELCASHKAQNEVMSQIMDQNNELLAHVVTEDDEQDDDGYLSG